MDKKHNQSLEVTPFAVAHGAPQLYCSAEMKPGNAQHLCSGLRELLKQPLRGRQQMMVWDALATDIESRVLEYSQEMDDGDFHDFQHLMTDSKAMSKDPEFREMRFRDMERIIEKYSKYIQAEQAAGGDTAR